MKHRARRLLIVAAMLPVCLLASERTHLESAAAGPIVIDGQQDDWSGALTPLGSEPVSIQVVNDNDAVYVRLVASDAGARRQILRQGMIVWFDAEGGTKKRIGIHYPVVERGSGGEGRGGFGGYGGRRGREPGEHDPGEQQTPREDAEPSSRVDILGPGKDDARSLTLDHASGIEVALHVAAGSLLYELKVPLTKTADHPYAVGAAAGATIGLGLETPKMERPSGAGGSGGYGGGMGGGMGGGGMGGGMRGRGMPRGGGGGGNRQYQPPKPLKGWATVTLSRPPAR